MNPLDQLVSAAAGQGHDYSVLVFRYLTERTLYRLGVFQPDTFVLKGGLYLGLLAYMPYRATEDTDLTAFGHLTDEVLLETFERLKADNPCPQDGVICSGKVRMKTISRGRNYQGVRMRTAAHIRHERRLLSFDISHGSAITPSPRPWQFPTIVPGLPEPAGIRLYPVETVVAEKLHAFHLYPSAEVFPRIRDLYDLAFLAATTPFDADEVYQAILRTFQSRKPTASDGGVFWSSRPSSLTDLDELEEPQRDWQALMEGATYKPELSEAVQLVGRFSGPLLDAVFQGEPRQGQWMPRENWRWT
jgi:hypothetical protein